MTAPAPVKGEVQTPRVTAFKAAFQDEKYLGSNIEREWEDFARQLERENAQLVEAIREWERSMGIMVRRAPMCDPGFVAIYQNMQRILAKSRP